MVQDNLGGKLGFNYTALGMANADPFVPVFLPPESGRGPDLSPIAQAPTGGPFAPPAGFNTADPTGAPVNTGGSAFQPEHFPGPRQLGSFSAPDLVASNTLINQPGGNIVNQTKGGSVLTLPRQPSASTPAPSGQAPQPSRPAPEMVATVTPISGGSSTPTVVTTGLRGPLTQLSDIQTPASQKFGPGQIPFAVDHAVAIAKILSGTLLASTAFTGLLASLFGFALLGISLPGVLVGLPVLATAWFTFQTVAGGAVAYSGYKDLILLQEINETGQLQKLDDPSQFPPLYDTKFLEDLGTAIGRPAGR